MEGTGVVQGFHEIRTVKQLTLWDTVNPRLHSSLVAHGPPDSVPRPEIMPVTAHQPGTLAWPLPRSPGINQTHETRI